MSRRADCGGREAMAARREREEGRRTGRSLSLILWLAFSLFALLVVVVFILVQNALVVRQYHESTLNMLKEAGGQMAEEIDGSSGPTTQLERRLINIANDYGLTVALFRDDGSPVFYLTEQTDYSAFAEELREKLDPDVPYSFYVSEQGDYLIFAQMTTVGGQPAFLYLSASMQGHLDLEAGLRWMSVITALVAIVLAFVVSGFVASFITRPVTEVTTRAQELARGNYEIRFRKDYFCAEISELSDALDHARSEIAKADTMQKELIANVSHDFKTPLTMIKAYASMIREISGENKRKRDAHAQVIIDECDRLTMLVSDLLDLSKLRAGVAGEEQRTVFDLSEEVRSVAERFFYLRDTGGYRIETEIADGLYAYANKERIAQVFYNLIGNAVNYTGEDKRVLIRLYQKGENARFEVIDTGKGIPADELDNIWDRYYRSGSMHKRPVSGTGLGLSIVKNILLQHGCPFGAISEPGKGSCFWAEFPPPDNGGERGARRGKEDA